MQQPREAEARTVQMLNIYADFCEKYLAIPMVKGRKTDKEKFAGAEATYTIEALMHDGKALQSGTSHNFGDGFPKAFGIQYTDKDNKLQYCHETSWGVSTRLIGAIIMVHGDDSGLVLPPKIAPTQVMVIPIQQQKDGVLDKAYDLKGQAFKGFPRENRCNRQDTWLEVRSTGGSGNLNTYRDWTKGYREKPVRYRPPRHKRENRCLT